MHLGLVAGPDPGHVLPVGAIGAELVRRGHTCTLFTSDRWRSLAERHGMLWCDLPIVAPAEGESLGTRMWVRSVAMARPLQPLLAERGIELVVADTLTICGGFAAALQQLPWVEVLPHPLQTMSVALPPVGVGVAPGRWWLTKGRDALLRRMSAPAAEQGERERAESLAALGLASCEPVLRLVGALPAMEHPRPDWPERTHLVGALEWEPELTPLELPRGDGPLVAVASSTASGPGHRDLLSLAIDAVRTMRANGVQARVVATSLDPDDRRLPPWAVLGRGSQTSLLDAADVVLCGGGGGILAKSLSRGVPVVVVPGPGDQRENAARVRHLGAGAVLRAPTAASVRAALQQVLTESRFTAAARAVGHTGRGLGASRAADLIEGLR